MSNDQPEDQAQGRMDSEVVRNHTNLPQIKTEGIQIKGQQIGAKGSLETTARLQSLAADLAAVAKHQTQQNPSESEADPHCKSSRFSAVRQLKH